jgi:hypothetical protein
MKLNPEVIKTLAKRGELHKHKPVAAVVVTPAEDAPITPETVGGAALKHLHQLNMRTALSDPVKAALSARLTGAVKPGLVAPPLSAKLPLKGGL